MIGRFASAVVLCAVVPAVATGQSRDTSAVCPMDTLAVRTDAVELAAVASKRDATRESAAEFAFRIMEARRLAPFVARLGTGSVQDLGTYDRIASGPLPEGFRTPDGMRQLARVEASWEKANEARFAGRVGARLWFQVNDAGKLSAARIDHPSPDSLLNVLLARAALAADSAHALAPLPPPLAHDPIDLWITLTPDPDTNLQVLLLRDAAPARRRVVVERFADADSAEHPPVEISHPKMRWPHELEGSDKTDTVAVEFTLGADGVPELATIHVVSAHYREFAREAVRMVAGSRFQPARRGRCPEEMQMMVPVAFTQQP